VGPRGQYPRGHRRAQSARSSPPLRLHGSPPTGTGGLHPPLTGAPRSRILAFGGRSRPSGLVAAPLQILQSRRSHENCPLRLANKKPSIWRALVSTATGIRTRVSAVRGRRPSPLDDSGGALVCRDFVLLRVSENRLLRHGPRIGPLDAGAKGSGWHSITWCCLGFGPAGVCRRRRPTSIRRRALWPGVQR
jgi:hypothetical protein